MRHPFEALAPSARVRALRIAGALFLLTTALIGAVDQQLRTAASPLGIVSFELAGTPTAAQAILDAWSAAIGTTVWAAFQTGFDYLYLVVYGVMLSLACAHVTTRAAAHRPNLVGIARLVTWLQLVASLADAVENGALMAMITRVGTDPYASVATGFALAKFACLAMGLVFLVVAIPLTRAPATAEG